MEMTNKHGSSQDLISFLPSGNISLIQLYDAMFGIIEAEA